MQKVCSRDESFEIILVYQLDRFARNKNDSGYYKKIASDSSGVITEGLLEVFADCFSKQLSEKVHRGMYQRAEQCKYNGGTMTFGYAVDDEGYYIIDENTGPIVKEIFERIASGKTAKSIEDGLGSSRVAKRLSQREEELEYMQKCLKHEEAKQCIIQPEMVRDFMRKLRKGTYETLDYQKMLVHIFVDKIFLYDDHFTLLLNNNKKRANTSKAEVETIEEYFAGVSPNTDFLQTSPI